jgi:hypothetical protein
LPAEFEGGAEAGSEWRRTELAADEPKLTTLRFVSDLLRCRFNRLPEDDVAPGNAANEEEWLEMRGFISSNRAYRKHMLAI